MPTKVGNPYPDEFNDRRRIAVQLRLDESYSDAGTRVDFAGSRSQKQLTWVQRSRDDALVSVPPCELRRKDNETLAISTIH